jgi:arginyl-tRNA synthetase
VQYAHARICSILRKAQDQTTCSTAVDEAHPSGCCHPDEADLSGCHPALDAGSSHADAANGADETHISAGTIIPDLSLLTNDAELDLAREMARLEEVVEGCANDLAPFRLTHYASELATAFHHFYTECQVIGPDPALTAARLYLCEATRSVLALTLELLGVSAPERM